MGTDEVNRELGYTVAQPVGAMWPQAKGKSARHYSVEAPLARGGQGEVVLGRQHCLQREVAIKRVRVDRDDGDGEQRLRNEAIIHASLEHPNIVPVYDMFEDDRLQVVMKRIRGESLETLIDDDSMALGKRLEVFAKVCDAVAFAHHKGFVHLDLKPANIVVGEFGQVYVVDWGLASQVDGRQIDALFGTLGYLAPEMLPEANGIVGFHTDVYLLGATLYHILEGCPPHRGQTRTRKLEQARASLPEFSPATSDYLAKECLRAMHPEPGRRHGNVAELRDAVAHYFEIRGGLALAETARVLHQKRDAEEDSGKREELYTRARFAYEQALDAQPTLIAARNGLRRLMGQVTHEEIRAGRPEKALALANSCPLASEETRKRAEQALASKDAKAEEQKELSLDDGRRNAKRWIPLLAGVYCAVLLLRSLTINRMSFYDSQLCSDVALFGLLSIGLISARRRPNRWSNALLCSLILLACLGILLNFVGRHHDYTVATYMGIRQFMGLAIMATFAIAFDTRLLIVSFTYALFMFMVPGPDNALMQVFREVLTASVAAVTFVYCARTARSGRRIRLLARKRLRER